MFMASPISPLQQHFHQYSPTLHTTHHILNHQHYQPNLLLFPSYTINPLSSHSLNLSTISHLWPTEPPIKHKPISCFASHTPTLLSRGRSENDGKTRAELLSDEIRATPFAERLKFVTSKCGKSKSISFYNDLIMGLVISEEFDIALKVFDEMPMYGLSPDGWTYSLVIRCYCKKNEPDEGKKILDRMIECNFRPNVVTLTVLVNCYCSRGRIERALEVVEMMGKVGCNPNVKTYNCVLKGLCFVGRVEDAYEMLMGLKSNDDAESRPDIYSYTAVMDGLCKVGRSDEAMELLEEAIKMGLCPNVVTYNTLLNGYCKEGKPRKGVKLLKQMKETGCMPDYVSYSTLLHGLLKWDKIMAAYWVYKEMVDVGFRVDERMMNTLLRGLCRKSWEDEDLVEIVVQEFDNMKRGEYTIFSDTYCLVSHTFCVGEEVDKALDVLFEMVEAGSFPRMVTVNRIIRGLCEEERVSEALSILVLVCGTGRFPSKISYNLLIEEFNRQRNVLGACNVYGAALKLGVIPHRTPLVDLAESIS